MEVVMKLNIAIAVVARERNRKRQDLNEMLVLPQSTEGQQTSCLL